METATEEKPQEPEPHPEEVKKRQEPEKPEIPFNLKPEEVTVDDLAADVGLMEMPDVHQYAIDAYHQKSGKAPSSTDEQFDPQIHVVDEKGNPVLNKKGKLKRKRGRKPGKGKVVIPPKPDSGTPEQPEPPTDPKSTDEYATGFVITQTCDMLLQTSISAEMAASDDEKEFLASSWAKYLEEKGVRDIPPGAALVMALATVYGQKLARPEPKTKTIAFLERAKIGAWRVWQKMRRRRVKPVEDSRTPKPSTES